MHNKMEKIEDLNEYQSAYGPDFKFNDENVSEIDWYSRRMCADMRANKVQTVLSLGIGHRIVSQNISGELAHHLKKHTILEAAVEIIEDYKKKINPPPQV